MNLDNLSYSEFGIKQNRGIGYLGLDYIWEWITGIAE